MGEDGLWRGLLRGAFWRLVCLDLGEGVVLSFVGIEGFRWVGSGLAIAGFWIVSLSRSDLSVRDCRLAIVVATLGAQAISPTTTGRHLILSTARAITP